MTAASWPSQPNLSKAAAEAASLEPATIWRRWFASLSKSTKRIYVRNWRAFSLWAIPDVAPSWEGVVQLLCYKGQIAATGLVEEYGKHLLASGSAPLTARGATDAVSALLEAARRAGWVGWKLDRVAPRIDHVERRKPKNTPPRHEIESFLAMLDESAGVGNAADARLAAIVHLFAEDALDRFEVADKNGLHLEHVQVLGNRTFVRTLPKLRRERVSKPVTDGTAKSLATWIALRGSEPGPLFPGSKDMQPLAGWSVARIMQERADKAGLQGDFTPRSIRGSLCALRNVEAAIDGLPVERKRETLQLALARIATV